MPNSLRMTAQEWAMLLLLSVLWGGSFLFIGIAIKEVSGFSIVAFRVLLASLVLSLVVIWSGRKFAFHKEALLVFLGMSLFNNIIPFNLIAFGQSQIESGLASILNATTPIFTMLIAHFFTRDEKMGSRKVAGVLLGFSGVVVLFAGRDLMVSGALIGQLACIGASISYGISGVFGRRLTNLKLEPLVLASGQLMMSALIMVPLALIIDQPFSKPMPSLTTLIAMTILGVVSTAFAYILFFKILTRAGATNISLVTLLVPCSAILFGTLILNEALGLREIAGFLVIGIGLLVIDGRILDRFSRPKER
jgi:drug/metabolite transporter (DMT)-like permease